MKFDQLPLHVKVEIIVAEGLHLGTTQTTIYQADLYAVGSEYVEVLLLPLTRDFVHVRKADSKVIDKYLTPISLRAIA